MSTAQLTLKKQSQANIKERVFRPVNDEYQPFKPVERRSLLLERWTVPMLAKTMGLRQGRRILEIGCGTGAALVPLARFCRPSRLVGIDIDKNLLVDAKTRLHEQGFQAELMQEDVRRLPFEDDSFDIVIDLGTFYHINRRVMALKEIERILAPGGILVTETLFNQILKHPFRSYSKRIPWQKASQLRMKRLSPFWGVRMKVTN